MATHSSVLAWRIPGTRKPGGLPSMGLHRVGHDWSDLEEVRRQHIKKQRHYFVNKSLSSQGNGFSSGHVWMWELDYKESWVHKHWCFWTVVLEKTLESPWDCKEIQPAYPKGDQSWEFTGMTDVEAETPVLWPPDAKSWLTGKDPDAGKDWGQGEKGTTGDEMAGWRHWLNGCESEWTPGAGDEQAGLACCDSWVAKSRTRLSDWSDLIWYFIPQKLLYLEAIETLLLATRGQKSCPSETIAFHLTATGHDPAVFPLPFLS